MNQKVSKLLKKFSKKTLTNYKKMKTKFKELNWLDKTDVIKEVKSLLRNEEK
jgi:hypothetical protein